MFVCEFVRDLLRIVAFFALNLRVFRDFIAEVAETLADYMHKNRDYVFESSRNKRQLNCRKMPTHCKRDREEHRS
jgi:hypothetical protein